MRFSYTEPVISRYSTTHTIQNDIYVHEAPTPTLTEHHTYKVEISYQWKTTRDEEDMNGLHKIGILHMGDTVTHYLNDVEPTPFHIEKELAVNDIKNIKAKYFKDKPYDCEKCIHCGSFTKDDVGIPICHCLIINDDIEEGTDFHMQSCTDYWPKREYIKDGLERKV